MKRHVVGKKCIRHYATDRVLVSSGDASELLCLQHFVKGGDTKFYKYPHDPKCQRQWILPGIRCNWGSNRAYLHMEQLFCWRFELITTLEVVPVALEGSDDPWSESNSLHSLNLWCAVMCGYSGAFFSKPTIILETTGRLQLLYCSYGRTILWESDCCMLCWSPVMSHTWQYPPPLAFWFTRIPVELCVSTLHKVLRCSRRHSNSLASLLLIKTLSAA